MSLGIGLGISLQSSALGAMPVYIWDFPFLAIPATATFARASTATYFDSAGALTSAAIDESRFGYDPATLDLDGLMVEGAATNYVTQSDDMVAWTQTRLTATTDHLTRTSTTQACYNKMSLAGLSIGTEITLSMRAKAGAVGGRVGLRVQSTYPDRMDAVVDLVSGILVGVGATNYSGVSCVVGDVDTDGFYPISLTGTPTSTEPVAAATGPTNETRPVAGWEAGSGSLDDCYVNNVQLEVGDAATSLIQTSGATGARSADVLASTGINGTYDVKATYGDGSTETFPSEVVSDGWMPALSQDAVKIIAFYADGALA